MTRVSSISIAVAVLALCLLPSMAIADPGWTAEPGAALEGGDALYCAGPCDLYGIRNVQSAQRLDLAAGNSDPSAGPVVAGSIAFCWDITCTVTVYGGHGNPIWQITPHGTYARAPGGRMLMRLDDRGITFYERPRVIGSRAR